MSDIATANCFGICEVMRKGRVISASGPEEAIDLARKAIESSNVWLRGQTFPWPPYSSLARLEAAGSGGDAREKLLYFLGWVDATATVKADLADQEQAIATAQHYGIPTYYLDFTASPTVAGFFASDCHSTPPGTDACIYLLDLDELRRCCEVETREVVESLQIYPIAAHVPNLWRLESQAGRFLNAPGRWFEWFEMDCILFPRGASFEQYRNRIYPRERSQLEDRLDHFFQDWAIRDGNRWFAEHYPHVPVIHTKSNDDRQTRYTAVGAGTHGSWADIDAAKWGAQARERYSDVIGPTIGITQDLVRAPGGLHLNIVSNIMQFMEEGVLPRTRSALFRCQFEVGLLKHADATHLDEALQRIWDGMRRLPFDDMQIAEAMANAVWLASDGLGWWQDTAGRSYATVISERMKDEWMMLEIGTRQGNYARALAPMSTIRGALREDLESVLNEKAQRFAKDLKWLLQVVKQPKLLFKAQLFERLLADYWIPSQALFAREGQPVFFSPLEIETVGLP